MPAVSGTGATHWRSSCDTNQTSPITTISTPRWFSGRRLQATMPLARNDQPSSSESSVWYVNGSPTVTKIAAAPVANAAAITQAAEADGALLGPGTKHGGDLERGRPATVLACAAAR